ncbi:hypothetical protein [Sphingomonas sp. IBVSS2]|uniref:hypothetical protein n=1 Tax=Sphingomonas sp. IBVSS2 TaxID=1985172 RepID=UPI001181A0DD|nr:hypothetical protein [Sphingomonas sp. IBVSS2]
MSEEYQVIVEIDKSLPFEDQYGHGCYVRETWRQNSKIDRRFGPAVTIRHPSTFRPIREEFYDAGKRSRYGGPAVIVYDHATGRVVMTQYFQEGKEVLPDSPHLIKGP